jgi:glycosyltransferase involved in cell wall biosynthesis
VGGPRLAIVIPAHRESASIERIVEGAARYGDVIVVDDCSPDDTGARAEAGGATVIRSSSQLGYEGALRRGFREADSRGFTHVVTMDADGEHDPACLQSFHQLLLEDGIPLVLGVRPRKQRLSESILALYVRTRFGARDILCGMKGYDLALYRANGDFSHSDSIGTELAINALRKGAAFREVHVAGTRRADAPRFDRVLRANLRILNALKRIMLEELGWSSRAGRA